MADKSWSVLGIIPARGGSKGVPRKNIRMLGGRPLIAHTIEQAALAQMLTRVIVSTDANRIAQVARDWGGEVLMRPAHLAQDDTPMLPVILHALECMEQAAGLPYDAVAILQPTSPLRMARDIDQSVRALLCTGADTVVTVCRVGKTSHPYLVQKSFAMRGNRLYPFWTGPEYEESAHENRDRLPPVVRLNGAVYAIRRETLAKDGIIGSDVRAVWMEVSRSIDIDTEEDLWLAEAIWRHGQLAQRAVIKAADAWERSVTAHHLGLDYDEWTEGTLVTKVRELRGGDDR